MPATVTLTAICTLALLVQLCIFLYLYIADPNRARFFRYLIWAWGFFVVLKGAELAYRLAPGFAGSMLLMNAAGSVSALLILAAGLAYRSDYRIRWHQACLGIALVSASALWGTPAGESLVAFPCRTLAGGSLLIGGLAFWPRRSVRTSHLGGRFLAISLVLWGLYRLTLLFLHIQPETGYAMAADVTFVFFYFLTVFSIIILVMDHGRAAVAALKDFNECLVDGLGEGLVLVDGEFTLQHANQWMTQQFGSVIGRRCYEVLTADGQQCPGCPMASRHQLDAPVRLAIVGPDERRFQLTCSPVHQPDGHRFLLELVADITEQERLRARLIETEQLAAAGELAAGMAHEIRNPLSAIVNATTLLEREAMLTTDERASILEAVKKEARRLNTTLADFLSFARPQEPKRVVGEIREVIGHVATLLREERTPAGGVQVEVCVDPAVPPCAFDPAQLTQVLWNIALNGVEAMEGHGRLRLEVGRQDGTVWIAVSDTGPGIPPEEHGRVFQPFFSKRQGGTGLGLAIARRIVMAHAGHIDLESVPGQGSRFIIRLPVGEVKPWPIF
jgi:signal transduction histidine kinase